MDKNDKILLDIHMCGFLDELKLDSNKSYKKYKTPIHIKAYEYGKFCAIGW